jgi:hypothetical protein
MTKSQFVKKLFDWIAFAEVSQRVLHHQPGKPGFG